MKKLTEINPLTSSQIKELVDIRSIDDKRDGRIMVGDRSVGLLTGLLYNGNIKFHLFYVEKCPAFFERAISLLEGNNPGLKFKVEYSKHVTT